MGESQEPNDRFLALASCVEELVFIWSASDGQMLWTNAAFVRETGMTVEDFHFDNRDNPFIHPDDLPHVLAALAAFAASDEQRSPPIENRFTDVWGRTRSLTSIAFKVEWQATPALMCIATIGRGSGEINAADASYQQLVEAAEDCILRLAADGRIVYSNRRFQRLLGLPFVEIATRRLQELLEPEHRARFEEALGRVAAGEAAASFEVALASGAEGARWMSVKLSHLADLPNTPCLAMLRDVTETRRLEEAVWRKQKLESLGVLAGGVAHDFNNISTAVVANVDLLQRLMASGAAVDAVIDDIRIAGERASALSRALLAYIGQAPIERQRVELAPLLRDTARVVAALVDKTAEIQLGTLEPCGTLGDPGQLSQIMLNLLMNAAQALAGRPGRVAVGLSVQEGAGREGLWYPGPPAPGRHACLSVRDDGPGMTPELLSRIFDPFFTTKSAGRGLGLPASLGIVRAHGGAMRVESQPNLGTTFEAWLPLAELPAIEEVPEPAPQASAFGRVLFVDDEELIRRLGKSILELEGYTVELAADGLEAVEKFAAEPARFRAVVIDTMMPRMRGDQAVRSLRKLRPDLPVVQASGYREMSPSAEPLPDVVQLPKPYSAAALVSAVAEALAR